MMQKRLAGLVIGAGALVLAASSGAMAQEGVAMKGILGSIGIIPKDPPKINYRERAPLVLPPKDTLPPPMSSQDLEAQAANWPKDPDVASARKEAAESKKTWLESELFKNSEGRRLSVEEMRAGRNPRNRVTSVNPSAHGGRADKSRMEPDELRAFDKQENAKLEGNGLERKYLSDPPQPLLKAAGNAPLKASQDKVDMRDTESPYAFQREQQQRY